ncbi:hypothetical protein [Mycolicibacterium sp. lyk4-40-TYG-92]|uniref:hypothetical protein n=1 Tax=Mycolicibacterium sp. lyk4-40-TYG-92 TaxID=3040295 RepID=UPI00254D7781|nr:hypothetical protein [Mycolicibacterium sp. lyk4-40-TYG-92]
MAYWQISEKEREQHGKLTPAARLLYYDAGAWAMQQVYDRRGVLPDQWFIPAAQVRAWGKKNAATLLVREGLWERAERDGRAGYVYVSLLEQNTPRHLRDLREDDRDAKRRRRLVHTDKG